MVSIGLQVLFSWVYSHFLEYFLHKYVLHNNRFKFPFKHHFKNHHLAARRNMMVDSKYAKDKWHHWFKDDEVIMLSILSLFHLPIAFWFPYAYAVLVLCSARYFWVHKKAHADTSWARANLPHHYDHHMGPNQSANWGVRSDILDRVFKSREVYIGTKRELINYKRVKVQRRRGVRSRSHRIERS